MCQPLCSIDGGNASESTESSWKAFERTTSLSRYCVICQYFNRPRVGIHQRTEIIAYSIYTSPDGSVRAGEKT